MDEFPAHPPNVPVTRPHETGTLILTASRLDLPIASAALTTFWF
jgi:hypothetical protein